MPDTAILRTRIDPRRKARVEKILGQLGLTSTQAHKKGRSRRCESGPWESQMRRALGNVQKKRIVFVAILACSSSEQPALVATSTGVSTGLMRSLLRR